MHARACCAMPMQEQKGALSFLAHVAAKIDKFKPQTCCIIGNYYRHAHPRAPAHPHVNVRMRLQNVAHSHPMHARMHARMHYIHKSALESTPPSPFPLTLAVHFRAVVRLFVCRHPASSRSAKRRFSTFRARCASTHGTCRPGRSWATNMVIHASCRCACNAYANNHKAQTQRIVLNSVRAFESFR